MMERTIRRRRRSGGGQFVSGLFVITMGLLFLLSNMGYFQMRDVIRFWPVFLLVMGIVRLIECRDGSIAGPLVWIAAGFLLLLMNLDVIDIDFRQVWPLFLIVIGLLMISRAYGVRSAQAEITDAGSLISGVAILGGVVRRSNSQDFKGGDLSAIMGGCEVDLRAASITTGEAVLDVFALFGGIEIKVPTDWTVQSRVTPLLGGFDDGTQTPKDSTKRLVIRGWAVMGGIEVKN